MKRLLFLSYFFPPAGGPGTQRSAKFCKYLGQFGWQPLVVTRQERGLNDSWDSDTSLLHEIGDSTTVLRVPEPEAAGRWVASLPRLDWSMQPWIEPAYEAALQVARRGGVDAVLVTMSPFSLAHIGRRLKKETGIPVVYDLRDPWAMDGWSVYTTRRDWRRAMEHMRETLTGADGVIANTPEAKRVFLEAIPTLREARVEVIPNGYDASDFEGDAPVPPAFEAHKFHLVHTGTLHSHALWRAWSPRSWARLLLRYRPEPIRPSGRTPLHLLAAVRQLRRHGHRDALRTRIVFVGQTQAADVRVARASGIGDQVVFTGYQSHKDCLGWMRHADGLFLPLHGLPPGRRSLIVPGKTYEYLASGRPILGCLPPGDARDLVEQSGFGFCADPGDAGEIAGALVRLYEAQSQDGFARRATPEWLPHYDRRALTHRLARFLNDIVGAVTASTDEDEIQSDRGRGAAKGGVRSSNLCPIERRGSLG